MLYHSEGASPLIMALVCGQYEAAAALIAAGAELTSRNARGCLVFSKASLSDFPIFPYFSHVRRVFWGNWQAGLRLFFGQSKDWLPKSSSKRIGSQNACRMPWKEGLNHVRGWHYSHVAGWRWNFEGTSCDHVIWLESSNTSNHSSKKWSINGPSIFSMSSIPHQRMTIPKNHFRKEAHWNLPTTDAATWRPVLGYPCALKGPWSAADSVTESVAEWMPQVWPAATSWDKRPKKAEGSVDSCWFKVLHGLARSSQGSDSFLVFLGEACHWFPSELADASSLYKHIVET